MTSSSSKKDKKCAKVICTFFGPRRSIHNTPIDTLGFIKIMIENEISIDNGVNTDVIIVNNNYNNLSANSFLDSFNGLNTKNGKIIVEHRPNIGGSFGAYYDIFLKYKNNYNYWFFCEDDVLIFKPKYVEEFINFLNVYDDLGFVSLAPISSEKYPKHSGGGCGLTSTEKFLKSRTISYMENFIESKTNLTETYRNFEEYEIDFTNLFIRAGLDIKNHPIFSPYCVNYINHLGQKNNYLLSVDNHLEKIYKIGF